MVILRTLADNGSSEHVVGEQWKQQTAGPGRGRAVSGSWYHPTSPHAGCAASAHEFTTSREASTHYRGSPLTVGNVVAVYCAHLRGLGRGSEVLFTGNTGSASQLTRFSGPCRPTVCPRQRRSSIYATCRSRFCQALDACFSRFARRVVRNWARCTIIGMK